MKVRAISSNAYAAWRCAAGGPVPVLHEHRAPPPEAMLQTIWQHQRLRRDRLVLFDGRRLEVLHPGFQNRAAGPDFQGAILRIEGGVDLEGDVEIDLHSQGWKHHRHQNNPAYARVILHVVWETSVPANNLPTLVLPPFLDAPLEDLTTWLTSEAADATPDWLLGQCSGPLRTMPQEQLIRLLHQAALVRMEGKARALRARAREAGWEQALWEGLFRALGYKNNPWPMQRLAEIKNQLHAPGCSLIELQARLLGTAGLLPKQLPKHSRPAQGYIRSLWDFWWRDQAVLEPWILPGTVWKLHGLRPANFPQRRLALAAHWWANPTLISQLDQWSTSQASTPSQALALLQILQPCCDDYWSWHHTLQSKRLPKALPLIGAARVTDLAVNVLIPFYWMRAVEGKSVALRDRLQAAFLNWPASEDNAVLKRLRQRLLGTRSARSMRLAASQQGLLQIARDCCASSNALCQHCHFPALLRHWPHLGDLDHSRSHY